MEFFEVPQSAALQRDFTDPSITAGKAVVAIITEHGAIDC
jgi:hypothetical protein